MLRQLCCHRIVGRNLNIRSSCLSWISLWFSGVGVGVGYIHEWNLTISCHIGNRISTYKHKSCDYSLKFVKRLFYNWYIDGSAGRFIRSQSISNHNFRRVFRNNTWRRIIVCIGCIFEAGIILFLLCLRSLV